MVIDSMDGVGLLKVLPSHLILRDMSTHLALYDHDKDNSGYRFFVYDIETPNSKVSGSGIRFYVRLRFDNAEAYRLLGDEECGVSIKAYLTWKKDANSSSTDPIHHTMTLTHDWADSRYSGAAGPNSALYVTVTGYESLHSVSVQFVVESQTGAVKNAEVATFDVQAANAN